MAAKHVALFLSSLAGGGAERVFLDLARAFRERGHTVDLVLSRLRGELVSEIPDTIRVVELGASGPGNSVRTLFRLPFETSRLLLPAMMRRRRKKVRSLPRLERYLLKERPDALLASTNVPNLLALWAAWLARVETGVFVKQDISLKTWVKEAPDPLERKIPPLMRRWYPVAKGIVAVSAGLAEEISHITGIPRQRINVIYNPIDLGRIAGLSAQELDHPWLQPGQPPVLLAVGRLHRQKDYPTLLRAFRRVREKLKARLIILGEGPERPRLEALIGELGMAEDVRLPGFQNNPFAYMARAAVFVLSSAWEGLSDVLIEALACGCRVVSTDCPHGPAEVLDRGRYGMLVPVGDPDALAKAIRTTLDGRPDPNDARNRAKAFDIDVIAQHYLSLLFNDSNGNRSQG